MAEELSLKIEEKPESSNGGRPSMVYHLDRDLTMTLVTKYDTARRYAVVRRWRELEEQEAGRAPSVCRGRCSSKPP